MTRREWRQLVAEQREVMLTDTDIYHVMTLLNHIGDEIVTNESIFGKKVKKFNMDDMLDYAAQAMLLSDHAGHEFDTFDMNVNEFIKDVPYDKFHDVDYWNNKVEA